MTPDKAGGTPRSKEREDLLTFMRARKTTEIDYISCCERGANEIETLELALQERTAEVERVKNEAFLSGILAALAVVESHDQPTIAADIVNTVDKAELFKVAESYDRNILAKLGIKQ